jgi:glycosyltransferase involved in cell wall biosynthesis
MKVLFCLNYFMPDHTGGTEVYTLALGKALLKLGHEITVVIPNFGSNLTDEYDFEGLKVIRYRQPDNPALSVKSIKTPPTGIQAFEEIVKRINPDIAHIQEISDKGGIGLFHLRLLKSLNIRLFYTLHIARVNCFAKTLLRNGKEICDGIIDVELCSKCALTYASKKAFRSPLFYTAAMGLYKLNLNIGAVVPKVPITLQIPFLIDHMKSRLKEIESLCEKIILVADWYKSVLIANGVDPAKIMFIRQALPLGAAVEKSADYKPAYPIKLMILGRINPEKGVHLLLNALENLPEEKICVDIFGGANESSYYKGLRERTASKANVRWMGHVPSQEVIKTMAGYDALVLASLTEMSPLIIQEAFAAGIPTIGSNIPSVKEQIRDRMNGFLFNFNDADSLKEVLSSIIDNPELLQSVREEISDPINFSTVVDQYLALYKSPMPVEARGSATYSN